jgi:hypothetical protein
MYSRLWRDHMVLCQPHEQAIHLFTLQFQKNVDNMTLLVDTTIVVTYNGVKENENEQETN